MTHFSYLNTFKGVWIFAGNVFIFDYSSISFAFVEILELIVFSISLSGFVCLPISLTLMSLDLQRVHEYTMSAQLIEYLFSFSGVHVISLFFNSNCWDFRRFITINSAGIFFRSRSSFYIGLIKMTIHNSVDARIQNIVL